MNDPLPAPRRRLTVLSLLAGALIVASLLFSSCGAPSLRPEIREEVEKTLSTIMEEYGIPGLVAGVWVPEQGDMVTVMGEADVETGRKMQENDTFRVGSITKTFTATLILQLVDEGLLSLDDKVEKFVPGIPGGDTITVRQLCNHTSGLYNYGEDEEFLASLDADPHRVWKPRELVEEAVSHPPYFPPGEGWHYSNTNYILLGMIIEKVTGGTYAEELRRRILEPLGLNSTYVADRPGMEEPYSMGYETGEGGALVNRTDYLDPSVAWSAGAVVSNLEDLRVWAKALGEGELLSEASHEEQMEWVVLPEDPNTGYGLGLFYLYGLVGHDGRQPGYDAAMFYYPKRQAVFIILLNKSEEASIAMGTALKVASIVLPEDISL
jgi:D-alanyl-D-alanine carboxypeptidase